MSLRECPGCKRHVKSKESSPFAAAKRSANGEDQTEEESACPFCAVGLAPAADASAVPTARLGRVALLALGATAVGAAIACESPPRAVYGGPPTPTAAPNETPPSPDASTPPPDAFDSDGGKPMISTPPAAVYGGPPVNNAVPPNPIPNPTPPKR